MRGLNYQLKQLCRHNRDGSFGTQVQRERELTLIANQLHELGYRCMNQRSLKPRHVEALVHPRLPLLILRCLLRVRESTYI